MPQKWRRSRRRASSLTKLASFGPPESSVCVVIFHSAGLSASSTQGLAEHVAGELNVLVITPDLPGHGNGTNSKASFSFHQALFELIPVLERFSQESDERFSFLLTRQSEYI